MLDFEQFRVTTPDDVPGDLAADVPGAPSDGGFDGGLTDLGLDAGSDTPSVDVPRDVPVSPTDGACAVTGARVRLAHLADGHGPVDLCMNPVLLPGGSTRAGVGVWPAAGIDYGQVSASVPTTVPVTAENQPWTFTVVPHDTACTTRTPIATLGITLDPGEQATLLLTRQTITLGRTITVLGLLADRACPDPACGMAPDVRAVHAAFGWAPERVSFGLTSSAFPGAALLFASGVPYGDTQMNGMDGYNCEAAWTLLLGTIPVQFVALDSSNHELARSVRTTLRASALRPKNLATVIFEGDPTADGGTGAGASFVVCYDGTVDAGLTVCDRFSATPPVTDAGRDGAVLDAFTLTDATVLDATVPDDVPTDIVTDVTADMAMVDPDVQPLDAARDPATDGGTQQSDAMVPVD